MDTQSENDKPTGNAECDVCHAVKRVCCGEYNFNATPTEFREAVCFDCCRIDHDYPRTGVGDYVRTDCDV